MVTVVGVVCFVVGGILGALLIAIVSGNRNAKLEQRLGEYAAEFGALTSRAEDLRRRRSPEDPKKGKAEGSSS